MNLLRKGRLAKIACTIFPFQTIGIDPLLEKIQQL